MCGIFCMLSTDQVEADAFHTRHIEKLLTNRGPSCNASIRKNGILFHGAVLWQQGKQACVQPIVEDELVLLFNGDLYMDCVEDGKKNDTEFLFELISRAKDEKELLNVFKTIIGPFSIICLFKSKLYFARDSLGRNSLIIGRNRESLFLSSVVDPAGEPLEAMELPPLGVFSVDLISNEVSLFPYQDLGFHTHNQNQLELLRQIVSVNVHHQIPPSWKIKSEDIAEFNFKDICDNLDQSHIIDGLLNHPEVSATCETFLKLLSKSVKARITQTPKLCKNCIGSKTPSCDHCHVGILFSGGVDCSMLALIADDFIDPHKPIDLMNVAFEKVNYSNKDIIVNWNVPDRLTGLETVDELRKLRPKRTWNFIEINITRAELNENMKKLSSLVFPLENVLDESLGSALYFASRGLGIVSKSHYSSPCRVILMGSGADELFGGYTRHRNAFKRSTPENDLLLEELNHDWIRLPSRNLARDDRVIADHGVTVRAPFVEENFVNFVQQLKPLQRCYPALPEGIGDKLLLRLCAYKLGLKNCSSFKKRALQFGSRIADKRQSAKDRSSLLANGLK